MKYYLLTPLISALMLFQAIDSIGQRIVMKAKGELSLAAFYSIPMGPKSVDGESTLLANMKATPSFEGSYVFGLSSRLRIGGWAGYYPFKDWDDGQDGLYMGTSMTFISGGGRFEYWMPLTSEKNKLALTISLSPGLSGVKVETSNTSEINGGTSAIPLTVQSVRLTISTQAGLHYNISNNYGLVLKIGYQYTASDSQIFLDKSFSFLNVGVGGYCRMFKDKRYKYSML